MFSSNSARYDGGAIYWDDSGDSIAQNTFDANSAARNGGAIYMRSSGEVLSHNVFWQNTCVSNGGAVYFEDPDIQVINNSLFGNSAGGTGGGMYFMSYYYSNASVINTILWGDSAGSGPELYVYGNAPEVTYCDVQGGWTGEENVDSPPLFRNSGTGDFHLMALACGDPSDSPCIDAGHPDTVDAVRDCVHGLGDARSDMGAYGGRNSGWVTGVGEEGAAGEARSPRLMIRNFPNPMREGTTISYWLPVLTEVRLDIYNILGEKVASLIHERQDEGYHEVAWGSTPFPPGMYFCRVTAGGVAQTGRMVRVE
jgi:predicted outer membrane repeat protein